MNTRKYLFTIVGGSVLINPSFAQEQTPDVVDEVIVTVFTTGPDSRTLPLVMFDRVKKGLDPSLNSISTVFIIVTMALVLVSEWLRRPERVVAKA